MHTNCSILLSSKKTVASLDVYLCDTRLAVNNDWLMEEGWALFLVSEFSTLKSDKH